MRKDVKNKLEWNIRLVYIQAFVFGIAFFYNEVIGLYYRVFSLSFTQISMVLLVVLFAGLLLEVPSGAFADLHGRKKSMMMAGVLLSLGLGVLAFLPGFWFFIIAAIFMGMAWAFWSGAFQALLYDSLKDLKREKEFLKIMSAEVSIMLFVGIASAYFGPYLFSFDPRIPFYVAASGAVLWFVFLSMFYEPKENFKKKFDYRAHYIQMKEGLIFSLNHAKVLWLILFSTLFILVSLIFGESLAPNFIVEYLGYSAKDLGLIMLISTILLAFLTLGITKLEKWLGEKKSLFFVVFGTALFFILIAFTKSYFLGVFFGLFWFVSTFAQKVMENYLNVHLDKKNRATVTSISSMAPSFLSLIFFPVIGFLTDKTSLFVAILSLGLISLFVGGILLFLRYNKKVWKSLD